MSDKINKDHEKIDEIKRLESKPKILKNLFSKNEINDFLDLYKKLPITVHNKKQNVIKKRWLKNFNKDLEDKFTRRLQNEIGEQEVNPIIHYISYFLSLFIS